VPLDDLLAGGQPDAAARISSLAVQPLEGFENLGGVLRLNSDPVVAHREPRNLNPVEQR
jgi:hypothetical protein